MDARWQREQIRTSFIGGSPIFSTIAAKGDSMNTIPLDDYTAEEIEVITQFWHISSDSDEIASAIIQLLKAVEAHYKKPMGLKLK